jgi:hypothetical protein
MSDLARYLAGDNYLTRSSSGLKRGLSALADSLVARSNEGTENMQAALSGVRVKPGAILTDAGYVMPDASGQPDFSQVGLEREPDVLRALELFGGAMTPAKGAAIAAKSGTGGKVAADVVSSRAAAMETARQNAIKMLGLPENNTAMDRARAMGFDLDERLYHGGASDIPEFTEQRRGVWLTNRPDIADFYAESAGGKPNNVRAQVANAAPNIIPVVMRGKSLDISDLGPDGGGGWLVDNLAKAVGQNVDDFKTGTRMRDLGDMARDRGFSAIQINDMADIGGKQSQWLLKDMSSVRSPFAAFDPARADSADLLASRANLGPIVNALLQGYDRQ